jgi:uncharacterized protein (TIGR02284 family)
MNAAGHPPEPMPDSDVGSQLRALIETCENVECCFRHCASNADRMDFQLMMTQRAATWRRWAGELRSLPDSNASVFRSSMLEDAALTLYSDMTLLAQCERTEEAAMRRYRDAIEQDLPRIVRAVLHRQLEDIQRSRANMRRLRAGTEHAAV